MRAPALFLAALALAAAGCDGGDSDEEDGEEEAVKAVVRRAQADPERLCTRLATRELVKRTGGRRACLRRPSRRIQEGDDYTIERVAVRGRRATVEVDLKGTTANDDTLTMVKRDGRWLVAGVR